MLHFPQWKVILVFGVVLAGIIFALPNLFARSTMESMPGWVPHHQVNLGLDLQGGAHLLYQLDENEMIEDCLNKLDVSQNGYDGILLKVTDAGLTQLMNSAIQASIETIRRRVDATGTTET